MAAAGVAPPGRAQPRRLRRILAAASVAYGTAAVVWTATGPGLLPFAPLGLSYQAPARRSSLAARRASVGHTALIAYEDLLDSLDDLEEPDDVRKAAKRLHKEGNAEAAAGNYVEAQDLYWASFEHLKKVRGLGMREGTVLRIKVANMHQKLEEFDDALKSYRSVRKFMESKGMMHSMDGAGLLVKIGQTHSMMGGLNMALKEYRAARRIMEASNTLSSKNGAMLLQMIGDALVVRNQHEDALREYEQAVRILSTEGLLETLEGGQLLVNIGQLHTHEESYDRALSTFKHARSVVDVTGGLESPLGIQLQMGIGDVFVAQGQSSEALKEFGAACKTLEDKGLENTLEGAKLLAKLGTSKLRRGSKGGGDGGDDPEQALQECERALQAFQTEGLMKSEEAADVLFEVGRLKAVRGLNDEALQSFQNARRAFEACGLLGSKRGAELCSLIGDMQLQRSEHRKAYNAYEAAQGILGALGGEIGLYEGTEEGEIIELKMEFLRRKLGMEPKRPDGPKPPSKGTRKGRPLESKGRSFEKKGGKSGGGARGKKTMYKTSFPPVGGGSGGDRRGGRE